MADGTFPVDGFLPKQSTEVTSFLEQHPEFDGRGTLVAILDTGVDPGAKGLQWTSDGKKKMVGVLDPSGGGDVDMSKTVTKPPEKDGCWELPGLSGRSLRVPTTLDNPSGQWRVGVKSVLPLFPRGLRGRFKAERKRQWLLAHADALVAARGALDAFDAANKVDKGAASASLLARGPLLQRNELRSCVEALEAAEQDYADAGVVVDCVSFRGGDGVWRALVDRSGTGDLRGVRALRPFAAYDATPEDRVSFEYDKWCDLTQLNFCVNVFHGGDVLSLVMDSGAHGTHVASITAGFHDGQPELTGVAPGAQVVSMKIGDGRLDGMETAASMIRAFNACVALGVDVVNMSFGEPTTLPDQGRVAELARELVERHGVVFVSSAGNAGPALSTVGAPGATSDAMIGVGAYVEPRMMLAAYSMKSGETPQAKSYTWSSRGPSYDGGAGVTLTAPGAAIAAVPEWTLTQKQLMNGTSMSSPNAAGGVALLVSAMRQLHMPYAPCTVKRALAATARWVPGTEVQAQGAGLYQVAKAFDALKALHAASFEALAAPKGPGGEALPVGGVARQSKVHWEVPYRVSVQGQQCRTNAKNAVGIYLREPWETQARPGSGQREFLVSVAPVFYTDGAPDCLVEDGNGGDGKAAAKGKAEGKAEGKGTAEAEGTANAEGEGEGEDNAHVAAGTAAQTAAQVAAHRAGLVSHDKRDRNAMEVRLHLRCTQPWVQCTPFVLLNASAKSIKVAVDVSSLPDSASGANEVAFAEVLAFDPEVPEALGPLWRIPVTVVRPEACDMTGGADLGSGRGAAGASGGGGAGVAPAASVARLRYDPCKRWADVAFSPGHIVRHFVAVPAGATWMDLTLRCGGGAGASAAESVAEGASRTFYVHCLQMHQQSEYRKDEMSTAMQLQQAPGAVGARSMAVSEGGTLEVCVAQFWSSLGRGPLSIELRFGGVSPSPRELALTAAACGVGRVELRADMGSVRVGPAARLRRFCQAVRPSAAKSGVSPMPVGARDAVLAQAGRPTYALLLTYAFKQAEAGKVKARVPLLDQLLYDSPVDSQMTMLFDEHRRLLACGDAWPAAVHLPKGAITARVLVRHEDVAKLERLKNAPLVLDRALPSDIALTAHRTLAGATTGGKSMDFRVLAHGERCVVWFAMPPWESISGSLPKGLAAGDVLTGSVTYGKRSGRDTAQAGSDRRPSGFPLSVAVVGMPGTPGDGPALKDEAGAGTGDDGNGNGNGNGNGSGSGSGSGKDDDGEAEGGEGEDGKESKEEGKSKPEDVAQIVFDTITLPGVQAKLKVLESLKKKTGVELDDVFAAQATDVAALIAQAAADVSSGSGSGGDGDGDGSAKDKEQREKKEEQLATLGIKVARTQLLRLAEKHKGLLRPKAKPKAEAKAAEKAEDAKAKAVAAVAAARAVAESAQKVIGLVNPGDELLLALARQKAKGGDLDGVGLSPKQKQAGKKVAERRQWLVEALVLRLYAAEAEAEAEADAEVDADADAGAETGAEVEAGGSTGATAQAQASLEAEELLAQVAEAKDLAVAQLRVDRHRRRGRLASALQLLDGKLGEPGAALDALVLPMTARQVADEKQALLSELGWAHLARDHATATILAFPKAYPPF